MPYVEQRDAESITAAEQASVLRDLLDQLTDVEAESVRLGRENVHLAAEVLRLAAAAGRQTLAPTNDLDTGTELERLEKDLKMSRQRWKVMKGTAAALVAGSGVDWVRHQELRHMVLDPE